MNNCNNQCPLLTTALIRLTQNQYALVSNEDYEWLSREKWHCVNMRGGRKAMRSIYGPEKQRRHKVYMHREIMGLEKGDNRVVDHINHNTLDNRRCELRICSQAENCRNMRKTHGSSQYKGVSWRKLRKKWKAVITINDKTIFLGDFDSQNHAAMAYNEAARKHYGEYACLNVIQETDHANITTNPATP